MSSPTENSGYSERGPLFAARDVVAEIAPELLMVCGHGHRWVSDPEPTRCPVCGTTTFKTKAAWQEKLRGATG